MKKVYTVPVEKTVKYEGKVFVEAHSAARAMDKATRIVRDGEAVMWDSGCVMAIDAGYPENA